MGRVPRFETTSAAVYGLLVFAQRESWTKREDREQRQRLLVAAEQRAHLPPLLDLRDLSLECLAFARHRRR